MNIAANQQQQFETLCRLIERPELAADARFAVRQDRLRNRGALHDEIEAALTTKSAADWSKLMNDAGVPAGEVLDVTQVLAHPQVVERELIRSFEHVPNVDRTVSVARSGFRLRSGDPAPAVPPPALGADTETLLAEIGYSQSEIEQLARDKVI